MTSILIVNYKTENELDICIESIYKNCQGSKFEILALGNDLIKTTRTRILEKYKNIKYIMPPKNLGYGAGNNYLFKKAIGDYLLILNSDTLFVNNVVDLLISFLEKNKNIGAVSPLVLKDDLKPYDPQVSRILNPISALFSTSFINKIIPNNFVANKHWMKGEKFNQPTEVGAINGACFMIRRDLFEKIGGFDENFFLYFEDTDLSKRLIDANYKNYIVPDARIIHSLGSSTRKNPRASTLYQDSRYYYFKKHFGIIKSFFLEVFLRINKYTSALGLMLIIGLFLRIYKLKDLMSFIGDQGLFYLPALKMVLYGIIPLVGPETSHPWIHHGPLWIYTLAGMLKIFNLDPVAPAYFVAILGTITIAPFYFTVKSMFNKNIALVSSILLATSPLIVINSRYPYHTSVLPFLVVLLLFLVNKLMNGNKWIFPVITFLLGVMYNHEITTFVYFIVFGIILFAGFLKKEEWFQKLKNLKLIFISIVSFLIPMVPFILYDTTHGWRQTLGFLVWVVYRIVKFPLSLVDSRFSSPSVSPVTFPELFIYYKQLILVQSGLVSVVILLISVSFFVWKIFQILKKREIFSKTIKLSSETIVFIFLIVGLGGLMVHRVPISTDLLLISPFVIIVATLSFFWLFKNKILIIYGVVIALAVVNTYSLINTAFLTNINGSQVLTYPKSIEAVDKISEITKGRSYNLVARGTLSDYPSFLMTYEYLLIWKNNPPSNRPEELKIVVWQKPSSIEVYKE